MKKKALAVTMAFALSAASMSVATVQPVLAQDTESQTETADFSKIAGSWENADSKLFGRRTCINLCREIYCYKSPLLSYHKFKPN